MSHAQLEQYLATVLQDSDSRQEKKGKKDSLRDILSSAKRCSHDLLSFCLFGVAFDVCLWVCALLAGGGAVAHFLRETYGYHIHPLPGGSSHPCFFVNKAYLGRLALLCLAWLNADHFMAKLFLHYFVIFPIYVALFIAGLMLALYQKLQSTSRSVRQTVHAVRVAQSAGIFASLSRRSATAVLNAETDVVFSATLSDIRRCVATGIRRLTSFSPRKQRLEDCSELSIQNLANLFDQKALDLPQHLWTQLQLDVLSPLERDSRDLSSAAQSLGHCATLFMKLLFMNVQLFLFNSELQGMVRLQPCSEGKQSFFLKPVEGSVSSRWNDKRLLGVALRDALRTLRSDLSALQQYQGQLEKDLRSDWERCQCGCEGNSDVEFMNTIQSLHEALRRHDKHRSYLSSVAQRLDVLRNAQIASSPRTPGITSNSGELDHHHRSSGPSLNREFVGEFAHNEEEKRPKLFKVKGDSTAVDVFVATAVPQEAAPLWHAQRSLEKELSEQLLDELLNSEKLKERVNREAIMHRLSSNNPEIESSVVASYAEAMKNTDEEYEKEDMCFVAPQELKSSVRLELSAMLRSLQNVNEDVFDAGEEEENIIEYR